MNVKLVVMTAAAVFGLSYSTLSAGAHHSFAAEYDVKKPLTLTGVVTKVEWTNPHARFYINVKDDKGTVTNWNFELASPNSLSRNGWTRKSLNVGDTVTVKGFAARADVKMANASSVLLSDGRSVFAGSPGGDAP
jgi:DNA/RNA endonuclease YhcR with UshA esterase domain